MGTGKRTPGWSLNQKMCLSLFVSVSAAEFLIWARVLNIFHCSLPLPVQRWHGVGKALDDYVLPFPFWVQAYAHGSPCFQHWRPPQASRACSGARTCLDRSSGAGVADAIISFTASVYTLKLSSSYGGLGSPFAISPVSQIRLCGLSLCFIAVWLLCGMCSEFFLRCLICIMGMM